MKNLNSAFCILHSAFGSWLPDMDLNHDKQIQSLLCYRYTIGQTEVLQRLGNPADESSRQAGSTANELNGFGARPPPGPTHQPERGCPQPQHLPTLTDSGVRAVA